MELGKEVYQQRARCADRTTNADGLEIGKRKNWRGDNRIFSAIQAQR